MKTSGVRTAASPLDGEGTFRSLYVNLLAKNPGSAGLHANECRSDNGRICTACHASQIGYAAETALKEAALQEFWRTRLHRAVPLKPLVSSPRGRRYRTVSKRKVVRTKNGIALALMAPDEGGSVSPIRVHDCLIEPEAHTAIYNAVQAFLSRPGAAPLLDELVYVVIKGNLDEQAAILNVRSVSGAVTKAVNALSRALTHAVESVRGVFLFEGEGDDRYYLGSKRAGVPPNMRRIYGPDRLHERVLGKGFLFSHQAFTQVNPAILDALVGTVGNALGLSGSETLYDLYCGYGVFGICLGGTARRVIGAEWTRAAVLDARKNAERNGLKNARFVNTAIDSESLPSLLAPSRPGDVAILDPPRNGTLPGVIEALAAKNLRRVVHLFCNIDLVTRELARWERSGYAPAEAIPFDMFPGTDSVEIMMALSPGSPLGSKGARH